MPSSAAELVGEQIESSKMFLDNTNAQVVKKLSGFEEDVRNLEQEKKELQKAVCTALSWGSAFSDV